MYILAVSPLVLFLGEFLSLSSASGGWAPAVSLVLHVEGFPKTYQSKSPPQFEIFSYSSSFFFIFTLVGHRLFLFLCFLEGATWVCRFFLAKVASTHKLWLSITRWIAHTTLAWYYTVDSTNKLWLSITRCV